MACKILNLIACIIYAVAFFFVVFSFEPRKMGGVYKFRKKEKTVWGPAGGHGSTYTDGSSVTHNTGAGTFNFPGEVLVHPFYISWTGSYDWDMDGKLDPPSDEDCLGRFGPTVSGNFDTDNGAKDGLLDAESKEPCIVSIVNATTRSLYAQRRYSNYLFGAAWQPDNHLTVSYGPKQFHKNDYALNSTGGCGGGACDAGGHIDKASCEGANQVWTPAAGPAGCSTQHNEYDCQICHEDWFYMPDAEHCASQCTWTPVNPEQGNLTPNTWATQDTLFGLAQVSGFFLAFGIIFHILAFLMGGFIWNYSKCCCDFGVCSFVFNSVVWATLSIVCYLVSIVSFGGLFFQGIDHDISNDVFVPEDERLEVVWSIGGALIITGMVFSAIAISLASYQWALDRQNADDDKMQAAVDVAVARASGRGV